MSQEFDKVFKKLDKTVTDMHYRWKLYRDVFAGEKEDFELLNKYGSNFFYYTQFLMLDHMALSFSKLTDPNKQRDNENLSLKQLHVISSNEGKTELVSALKIQFDVLLKACSKFRLLRNKRIAHSDLNHELGEAEEPLPGLSRAYVENALSELRTYMNIVNNQCYSTTVGYEHTDGQARHGGRAIIHAFRKANNA
jgi:hypothetical protein